MEQKWIFWTTSMVLGLLLWFYWDTQQEYDYHRHSNLIDPTTGAKRPPSDLLDLPKVIKYTTDYIESTNAYERLYDLEYQMYLENLYNYDQSYSSDEDLGVSGWPVANQTACGQQLGWILSQLNLHPDYAFLRGQLGYELTSYMDSFGRPESGLYSGAVHWMGSSTACGKVSLDVGRIMTRYCIARMRPIWWPRNESLYGRTSIRMGICLPETCDTLSYEEHEEKITKLIKWQLPEQYKQGFDFESIFCLPDERSPIRRLPTSGKIYLSIVGCWMAIVLVASIFYEVSYKRKNCHPDHTHLQTIQLLLQTDTATSKQLMQNNQESNNSNFLSHLLKALSIREAFKSLGNHSSRPKYNGGQRVRLNLDCLSMVKSLMTILIVFGHAGHLIILYTRSLRNRIDLTTGRLALMTLSISLCVETFFIIFGLLSTYSLMKKWNAKQLGNPFHWLSANLITMIRITPVFMLVYWYVRSVSLYTGSGAWWDYGVDEFTLKGVCVRAPWWKSIPYFGNLGKPPINLCIPPGWFMVTYAQLSLLVPPVTYLIVKAPNYLLRFSLIGYILLVGASYTVFDICTQKTYKSMDVQFYSGFIIDFNATFEFSAYLTSLRRFGGVSVGCLVGYLLRRYEIGEIKSWPRWLTHPITIIITILYHLWVVFAPHFFEGFISLPAYGLLSALIIFEWPILNSIIFINLTSTYNHKLIPRFCSHTMWHSFNKLGLALFLVHWEIINALITNSEYAPTYGVATDWVKVWSLALIMATLISIMIYVFIQAPIAQIINLRIRSKSKEAKNNSLKIATNNKG